MPPPLFTSEELKTMASKFDDVDYKPVTKEELQKIILKMASKDGKQDGKQDNKQ